MEPVPLERPLEQHGLKYMRPEIREAHEEGMRLHREAMRLLAKH